MPEPADHADHAPTLLIVEDDDLLRERLVRAFNDRGYATQAAASVAEALAKSEEAPELAVVDLRIGDESGLEVLRALLEKDPATRVVMLTGYGSIATAVEAIRLGAVHYLTKPAEVKDVLAAFERTEPSPDVEPSEGPMSLEDVEWEHLQQVL